MIVRTRLLGQTGARVSEVGLGTWGIGGMWGPRDDRLALQTLHRALDLGVTFMDTALGYGEGHSEQLIARAFRERRTRVFVATKIPPKDWQWPARHDTPVRKAFPKQWIIACTERSLRNLKTDVIDLQQLHVWVDRWMDEPEWYEALSALQAQGKIRHIGVSINDHVPESALRLVTSGWVSALQVIYNLFDQTPADQLLPLAKKHKVGILVRCPFDEGGLTGTLTPKTVFHKDDWRRSYFRGDRLRETVKRAERFRFLVRGNTPSLAHAALTFCLSHQAVSTVIPGARRPHHVEANCLASRGRPFSPTQLAQVRRLAWSRNFYS